MRTALMLMTASLPPLLGQTPGLRLFAPRQGDHTLLVDGNGATVHSWTSSGSMVVHLDDDGNLLCGMVEPNSSFLGTTGRLQRRDVQDNLMWDLMVSDADRFMHHDICSLPNGNVLVMTVDRMTRSEAIAAGRDPALLTATTWLPETILEIQQTGLTTGEVVWQWRVMDHIVQDFDPQLPNYGNVADHPGRVDINYPPHNLDVVGDWNHANAIDYDPANDWIIISARDQNECWIIDHSTTTAEAASNSGGLRQRGGDLIWRWGNPECYQRGGPGDQQLFQQHDPRFIPPGCPGTGNITIFNNRALPQQSTVIEIDLPVDASGNPFVDPTHNRFGPTGPVWSYTEPGFFSPYVSSAQRLRSGNTLICSGVNSTLLEVTPSGETVWSYVHPAGGIIFQADAIERRLWSNAKTLSVGNGGAVTLTHIYDSARSGHMYYLLGSLAGTSPGYQCPSGLLLPLNPDTLFLGMLIYPNATVFQNTLGAINPAGKASSAIIVPPNFLVPSLVGAEMNLSHILFDTAGYADTASNVVTVKITH